jgi:hypothetical protein
LEIERDVESDGVGDHCSNAVRDDETGAGIVEDDSQGHNGERHAGLDPDEQGEADTADCQRCDDEGVRPFINISS